jgi:Domain of unknown function (DUF4402)
MATAMTKLSAFHLTLAGFAVSLSMSQAHAGTGTGTVKVTTIGPLNLAKTADLDFGYIIPSAAAGTVVLDAQTAARSSTGGVVLAGGPVSTGNFVIAANAGRVVSIVLNPAPSITLNRVGGGATMTINQVRVSRDGGAPAPFGPNATIGTSGALFLKIGGRLNINANQLEGVYTSTFSVTVDYQ